MTHLLEADNIVYNIGQRPVLRNIHIHTTTGTITGILGRNGCGKTTLFNIVFGSLPAEDAIIRINKRRYVTPYTQPQLIQLLPQFHFIPRHLTVKQVFIDFGADYDRFLQHFRLSWTNDDRKKPLSHLSGGQQRLAELFLLVTSPSLFCLLDEPFSFLDPIKTEAVIQLLQAEKHRKGFIITDHLYKHVLSACDEIHLLKDGHLYPIKHPDMLQQYGYLQKKHE